MAGLYVKELILRGDASNVLVVAPGLLGDQWQDELSQKFSMQFEQLSRDRIVADGNLLSRGGLWIARLDVLARNSQGILDKALECEWDLVIAEGMTATMVAPRRVIITCDVRVAAGWTPPSHVVLEQRADRRLLRQWGGRWPADGPISLCSRGVQSPNAAALRRRRSTCTVKTSGRQWCPVGSRSCRSSDTRRRSRSEMTSRSFPTTGGRPTSRPMRRHPSRRGSRRSTPASPSSACRGSRPARPTGRLAR